MTYFEWFRESFKIDQTLLIKSLISNSTQNTSIEIYNCFEYYISNYNILLKTEVEKDELFSKHFEVIRSEKANLKDCFPQTELNNYETYFSANKVNEIKECIQEIEVQEEIIKKLNSNLRLFFDSCKWYPFINELLFQNFQLAGLPLIKYERNMWIGILPEKILYERQVKFFKLLNDFEVPDNSNLLITKLRTQINLLYSKQTINGPLTNINKPIVSTIGQKVDTFFKIKERRIARQKVLDDWSNKYIAMHQRG